MRTSPPTAFVDRHGSSRTPDDRRLSPVRCGAAAGRAAWVGAALVLLAGCGGRAPAPEPAPDGGARPVVLPRQAPGGERGPVAVIPEPLSAGAGGKPAPLKEGLPAGPVPPARRQWDSRLKSVRTIRGPLHQVVGLALSPDGKTLAVACVDWNNAADGAVRLVDVASGRQTTLRGHTAGVFAVAFSPGGKTLASGGYDKTIKLWDAPSGKNTATLRGHNEPVGCLLFSPDGKALASAVVSGDGKSPVVVMLWDAGGGTKIATLKGHALNVNTLAFSPDGKTLASAGHDFTVRLWDAAGGKPLATLGEHSGVVHAVAFSPDGSTLATAGQDNTIRIWVDAPPPPDHRPVP